MGVARRSRFSVKAWKVWLVTALFVVSELITGFGFLWSSSVHAETPPTVSDYDSSDFVTPTSASEVTGSITWSTGDLVLVFGGCENGSNTLNTPTATGLSFGLITSIDSGVGGNSSVFLWSATAASGGSGTVTSTINGGSASRGLAAYVFSGSGGLGGNATLSGSTAKTISLTRGNANSAVATMLADWNAISDTVVTSSPGSGTVRQATESPAHATYFVTDWGDQGSPGVTSYGITNHTGTVRMSGIAVEVKGLSDFPLSSSTSETVQSTTSTTYVASDTSIAGSSLPAGTYLVSWGAAVGSSSANEIAFVRLLRGATVIAELGSEGNAGSSAVGGRSASGYWLGSLSGSEALTIQYRSSLGTATAYIDSKFIKAVQLDLSIAADTDYWTTGSQESGSDETANAATASFTTVKTLTKTFDATNAQDYIVLASMEISPDSTTNDCNAKLVVDGLDVTSQTQEGEDTTDIHGYVAADLRSIGSGSKTITLQGQSVGSATCDFLRSRIYVFRAGVFDQVLENESLGENTLASTTWTTKNTQAYTPNQAENVMVISTRMLAASAADTAGATRINNTTDAILYADTMSHAVNNQAPDYYTGMAAASLNMSTAKTFTQQYQRAAGTGSMKIKEGRLLVWSLTLRDPATYSQSGYRWFSNTVGTGASGTWWNTSWKNRRKITFSNSQSSENLVDFPVRISLVGTNTNNSAKNIDYAKTQGAGQDIRFIDTDGTTVLKHEIESWDETGTSEVWVKVPQIDSGSTTDFIWMYYNNTGASDGQDAVNTWEGNYKGVWHLKENPAGGAPQMQDSTGSNLDGTSNGSMASTDQKLGYINGSLNFNGTSQYVDIGHQSTLYTAAASTTSCWVKPTGGMGVTRTALSDSDATGAFSSYALQISTTNVARIVVNSNPNNILLSGTTSIVLNQWYQITAVWSGSNTLTLYVNGATEGTPVTNASALPAFASTGTTAIGKTGAAAANYFPGQVDECRYSSTNRSAEWIEAEYKNHTNQMNSFSAEEADTDYSALAAANTSYTLTTDGQDFRLRLLLHTANNSLYPNTVNFKLQTASKSGTCDTGYSGETYADVATGSGDIRYKDNSGETDNAAMIADSDDPTHSGHTVIPQTYEEANNFTSTSHINRNEDGEWEFALTDFSASSGAAYCFRVVKSDGSAIDTPGVVPEIITAAANSAPSSPSSLAQKKTDDTTLSTGAWTNETSIKLTATVTDSDGGDTVKICAEVDPIATALSSPAGDGDGCSTSGVSTGGTATVTISGLSTDTEYHWQIKAKDASGAYSSWVTYGGNTGNPPTNPAARDFGIDTSAPTGGTVYDGTTTDVDKSLSDSSLSQLSANWSGFSFTSSGILKYEYSIGTTAGATDVKNWTDNSTTASVTATGLTLQTSQMYFFNVRASDNAGNTVIRSSNGQLVAPSLSFAVSPSTITFDNLNAGNSYTNTKDTTLTTSTNAYGGYVVRAFATDFLRSAGNFTVDDFNGGTYAAPDTWQAGDTGFGYTSSDTSVQGSNKFQNNPCPGATALVSPGCYAPFSATAPGDIIADHTSNVTGTAITNEAFTITLRTTVAATQPAARYQTILVYSITPIY